MRLLFGVLGTNNQPAAKECKLVIVTAYIDYVHCTVHRMNNIIVVNVFIETYFLPSLLICAYPKDNCHISIALGDT